MIEFDIVYYKKKKEYENLLLEFQQLKQFEEKVNSHPELLLKEIEILNNKIKEEQKNYDAELKRMKIREENKLKDINEKRQQSINYVILESYNHVSPKLIQAYIDRVDENRRLHYENHVQHEFQRNIKREIDRLKKENKNIQNCNTKMINEYSRVSKIKKSKKKASPNEIYTFETTEPSKNKQLSKKQIILNKIQDLKALTPIQKE